jgi:hypothetical protein
MSESEEKQEEKQVKAPETSKVEQADYARLIADQQKKIEVLEKAAGEDAEPPIELVRERDRLRHYHQAQKGNPKERAKAKAEYASKAALSRAIKPLEK